MEIMLDVNTDKNESLIELTGHAASIGRRNRACLIYTPRPECIPTVALIAVFHSVWHELGLSLDRISRIKIKDVWKKRTPNKYNLCMLPHKAPA